MLQSRRSCRRVCCVCVCVVSKSTNRESGEAHQYLPGSHVQQYATAKFALLFFRRTCVCIGRACVCVCAFRFCNIIISKAEKRAASAAVRYFGRVYTIEVRTYVRVNESVCVCVIIHFDCFFAVKVQKLRASVCVCVVRRATTTIFAKRFSIRACSCVRACLPWVLRNQHGQNRSVRYS